MNSLRFRAALAALITAMMTAVSLTVPSVAHAVGREDCSLQPSGHAQGNEWLGCLRVNATLDTLPAVGDQATLDFEVTSQLDGASLTVEAQLPSNLDWVTVPEGFEPRDRQLAIGSIALGANETRRFRGTVRATEPGGADISVRVTGPREIDPEDGSLAGQDAAEDHQYLTVAEAGGRSTPGIEGRPEGDAAPSPQTAPPTLATPELEHNPVPDTQPAVIMAPGQTSCVKGSFGYAEGAVNRLSPNITVEVWDADLWDAGDLLATGITNASGAYNICFPTDDPDGPFIDLGQDVWVKFVTTNSRWRVQETGTGALFSWGSPVVYQLGASVTHNFGYLQPGDPKYHLGLQAFDAVNDFWKWKPGACWDSNDSAVNCKQVIVNWRWDSAVGTYFDGSQVFLMANDPKARKVTVHEATHAVMSDVYEGTPIPGSGGPHQIHLAANVGMAWVEGFAEWVPAAVYNSPSFDWADGSTLNLETPKWGTAGWSTGDATEGRVAGALIDLSDAANEQYWDRLSEGNVPGNIWKTFLGPAIGAPRVQKSFKDFWTHRTADGFNVAASGALASVYQNTIDYSFRDPIGNYTPLLRPHPYAPHNFSFNTTTAYWSAIANRPTAGMDQDLRLYEDFNQATLLATSNLGASTVDFIAIDSNKKALTDYYPRINAFSGTGNGRIQLAQGSQTLSANSSQSVSMGLGSNVVAVRDTHLTAGTTVTIKVTPTLASQDPELFLMRSTTGTPSTYVRTRAQAYKASTAAGPGAVESFTFVVPSTDWYGVVIVFKGGLGNLTLQRIG